MEPIDAVRRRLRRRRRRSAWQVLHPLVTKRIQTEVNPPDAQPLEDFRFFAILGTWMEEDVVEATVRNALTQGVEKVFVVDNASTDATVERAVSAGATLAESFDTDAYEEPVRILLMNAVVARESLSCGAPHIWWLWLDADEFPEGPGGLTVAEYLRTLDRRFRLVGSTYYNHFPTDKPEYLPGFHPIEFQPMCEQFVSARTRFCDQPHWKHPLQRFDRQERFVMAGGGFHTGTVNPLSGQPREPLWEPEGGVVTHHVQYREELSTRARLELMSSSARTARDATIGNTQMLKRFSSLDAVYRQDWPNVDNLRGGKKALGVSPRPWPDPDSTRRWYDERAVDQARRLWLADNAARPRAMT